MSIEMNIIIFAFILYWMIVIYLNRKGTLEKYNISAIGPILMIRSRKGLKTVDRLSKPKAFWRLFANAGILLMFAGMLFMFIIVLFSDYAMLVAYLSGTVPKAGQINEIQNLFLIPGVNDYIPFVWGLIALVVTLVVHEFAHAILCRAENIKVKSMGILYALIPVGGFAEPDEKELFGASETDDDTPAFNDLTASIEEIRAHEALQEEKEKREAMSAETQSAGTGASAETSSGEAPVVATKTQRARILSAGVMANFCTAFIAFALFFGVILGSIAPVGNFMITDVPEGSPAEAAGLSENMILKAVNGKKLEALEDLSKAVRAAEPGKEVMLTISENGREREIACIIPASDITTPAGIEILSVTENSPAGKAGLAAGMIITAADGKNITGQSDFQEIMQNVSPGDTVSFTVISGKEDAITETISADIGMNPQAPEKSYLGITFTTAGHSDNLAGASVGYFNASGRLDVLKRIPGLMAGIVPEGSSASRLSVVISGWIILLILPFFGLFGEGFTGFSGTMTAFYEAAGWAEPFGIAVFWAANALLWIGWMNFYVGLFNCLPSLPLDGGHVFRATIWGFLEKCGVGDQRAEIISGKICLTFTALIVISFLFMIFWPYVGKYFI